jgi:hypothetical protein
MTDLFQGKGEFRGRSISDRVAILDAAIDAITSNAMGGVGAMVDQHEFELEAGPDWPTRFGSTYSTLCQRTLQVTAAWLQDRRVFEPVVYVFEKGHKYEHEADAIMNGISETEFLRKRFQYAHHSFAHKHRCYGAQAADILAWLAIRIHLDKPSSAGPAFYPSVAKLSKHFEPKGVFVPHYTGDRLKSFISQQKERPPEGEYQFDVGPRKRSFR